MHKMYMGKEPTIENYISKYNKDSLVSRSLYLQQAIDDKDKNYRMIIVNGDSLLTPFYSELKDIIKKETLTDEEYLKYRFNPKLLSYDLYGTTELWSLLLDINELTSVTEFDMKELKVFPPTVTDKLDRIINLSKVKVNYNAEVLSETLANS